MNDLSHEIAQARYQISRAGLLRKIAQSRYDALVAEMQRGKNLRIIAYEILTPSIHAILLALPSDGSWAPGSGHHWRIISDMLDQGSPLIEEDAMAEDDDTQWRVRLSTLGMAVVADSLAVHT